MIFAAFYLTLETLLFQFDEVVSRGAFSWSDYSHDEFAPKSWNVVSTDMPC
jgi:hypothetical protein